jgi:drug/metabolite transporter (DMT)-like permease
MTRRQWLYSALLGALNPFLYYCVLFKAYALLPAQEAQAINYTWAITLTLLAIPLLGQRPRGRDLPGHCRKLCRGGGHRHRGDLAALHFASPTGVALALFSTVIWALYWIAGARDDRDPVAGLCANFLCSLPVTLAAVLLVSDPLPGSLIGLLSAVYVGVFEMGLAFVTWLTALRLAENASRVANLIFLSPVVSLVLIHFVVGEPIAPSTILGLACILSGLALQRLRRD